MKRFLWVVALFLITPAASADPMDALIAEYEAYVRDTSPEEAARAVGEAPSAWGKVTPEAISERAARAQALRDSIAALETDQTTDRATDQAILERLLSADINDARFDAARIPFTGDWGFQAEPVFAALQTRISTEAEGDAWIARLNDVPRYFAENVSNMRRGLATGWVAHADPLKVMSDQIREQIGDDPSASDLYVPFHHLPADMDPAVASRLKTDGLTAVANAISAYRKTLAFIEADYAPRTRAGAGIANLPDGVTVYTAAIEHHTAGAGYTPDEIHELGRTEVARIRAEMEEILHEIRFEGDFRDFLAFLRTDPAFYAKTPDELMNRAKAVAAKLDAILPDYFGKLPKQGYTVEPVPAAIAPGYTSGRYVQGDPQEDRPGTYLVNTYALDQRPLYELPALSAHEAVPGHHLQIMLAMEMEGQPRFRQQYYATAFGEGWGLYAEYLAMEAGLNETPYERFGGLSMEMWRACRLVADTGLHLYGWTREEAEACFVENSALAPLNIQNEVTRYMGWPGQATAYKIGELKILDLRHQAEAALGDAFDIRAFHDAVLSQGAVPLDVLDRQIQDWIAGQLDVESEPAVP
ncbi:DUF885 domain-containing protein [uncultured Hyphomonas sp.]|uniref:DUF885 domain-containing protein n=1 Tax=uncultured Hyphomonas sp. TaxID=225298 RepID=UPI002AAB5FFA|nr:DUF885 domain-containing protein [uncultured Hyphomonas sp.]